MKCKTIRTSLSLSEVEIDNFDMSFEECSTGFHFFCTEDEAMDYG